MPPLQTRHPDAARMFAIDAHAHQLEIRHDDGLYRHLAFRRPDTSLYWFSLVTWPGSLCFHGDYGTWVFSRDTDMIDFFATARDINPGYWGEKVQGNGDARDKRVRVWSEDRFREHVRDSFEYWCERVAYSQQSAAALTVWRGIERDVLSRLPDGELAAREAVRDFDLQAVFADSWEWDCDDFSPAFLWACFAIRSGVNQYRLATDQGGYDPLPMPVRPLPATVKRMTVEHPPLQQRPRMVVTVQPQGDIL